MSYSHEEIEQKRLLALQKRKEAQLKTHNVPTVSKTKNDNEYHSTINNKSFTPSKTNSATLKRKNDEKYSTRNVRANKDNVNPISTKDFFGQKSHITGKCYMITDNRFIMELSKSFYPLTETFKSISTRLYDSKTKTWSFHIKDYENLIQKVIQFKSDVQIVGLPNTVLKIFRKSVANIDVLNIDLTKLDPKLTSSLMPFQREGICYGISKGGRCIIADDMGLGKTIQALGIACYFKENWPLLIITPSSVKYQWSESIFNFVPSIPSHYVHHIANVKDYIDHQKIVIISYDLLVRMVNSFENHVFGFIIMDESHLLKSIKTARFKAAKHVASRARHVILLSGTPALSRPIELYSQISLVSPNFMGYQDYGIRYCAGVKSSFGWDFTGSSNMQELQMLLKRSCMIRRLKNEVLHQLPAKRRQVIILDPVLIKADTKEMLNMSQKLEQKSLPSIERHNTLLQYYNESSIVRLKAVCNYVTNLLESRKKFLVYAHHQNFMDAICQLTESMNIKYIRIDGKTNSEYRKHQVDKFQECDDYLVAVLSITAANSGITLTAAQLVVFTELFWNPGILCQAEDRVYRIGQHNSVIIQYLVAKQTVDDYLWPLIQRKMNVLNEAGLDQDFSLKEVNVMHQKLTEKGQSTLNSYVTSQRLEHKTGEEENACLENKEERSKIGDECEELWEEEFDFCDWDNIA
ncbi:hypothetical protein KM043_015990 [Ampulex compressa]|nr:hypothetical protein KM043_015990 [Ampulex compressa]